MILYSNVHIVARQQIRVAKKSLQLYYVHFGGYHGY